MSQKTTALIVGSTGLVGGYCLSKLLADDDYTQVIALTRSSLELQHPKLVNIVVDFENLQQYAHQIVADPIFCCLGTTIKKAGTKERFSKVDYEYPL